MKKIKNKRLFFAVSLMLISNLGWIVPLGFIPWLINDLKDAAVASGSFIIFGQVTYNIGLLLAGKEVLGKLKERGINTQNIKYQIWLLVSKLRGTFHL